MKWNGKVEKGWNRWELKRGTRGSLSRLLEKIFFTQRKKKGAGHARSTQNNGKKTSVKTETGHREEGKAAGYFQYGGKSKNSLERNRSFLKECRSAVGSAGLGGE